MASQAPQQVGEFVADDARVAQQPGQQLHALADLVGEGLTAHDMQRVFRISAREFRYLDQIGRFAAFECKPVIALRKRLWSRAKVLAYLRGETLVHGAKTSKPPAPRLVQKLEPK